MIRLPPFFLFQNPLDLPLEPKLDYEQNPPAYIPWGTFTKNLESIKPRSPLQTLIPTIFRWGITHSPQEMGTMSRPAPKKNTLLDFLDALPAVADAIERADVDFYDLPFSRNVVGRPDKSTGLKRFSEYKPKKGPYTPPQIEIDRAIFGRAHGEIRPIKGTDESLITRVALDYQGGEVLYHVFRKEKYLGPLELDCFTSVTPPTMEYDFSLGPKSPTKIGKDGNTRYENACIKRKPGEDLQATDFYSEAKPPPRIKGSKNPDWMFYFQPNESTLWQSIMRRYTNKSLGALWLWAFNPTFGLVDRKHYEALGIRYNTMPRKFGDLLRLFSALWDPERGPDLRHNAPFLNPNNEYLACDGTRQKTPKDPQELLALNKTLKACGRPEAPRSRGPAVDWTFMDLMDDPERMAATPKDRWPRLKFRMKFKPGTVLKLPVGNITVHPDTELTVSYRAAPLVKMVDGKKQVRAQTVLSLSMGPLDLGKSGLDMDTFDLTVGENLHADRLEFHFPFVQVYDGEKQADGTRAPKTKKGWKLTPNMAGIQLNIQGLKGKDIQFEDKKRGVTYKLGEVQLLELKFSNDQDWAKALIRGLQAKGLEVEHEVGSIVLESASVPKLELKARHDLKEMSVDMPQLSSKGEITISPNFGTHTVIAMDGSSQISKLHFDRKVADGRVTTHLGFQLEGAIRKADVTNPLIGKARLSMQEGRTLHHLKGEFQAELTQPEDSQTPGGNLDYQMSLNIPYTGFHLSSPIVDMPEGASSLRDGTIKISKDKISFEGDLKLEAREVRAPGTDIFRWYGFTVNPHLEDVNISGSALLEYSQDGFRLSKRKGGRYPIVAGFRMTDSSFTHAPTYTERELKAQPELSVIRSDVKIDEAKVLMEDIQEFHWQTIQVDGKKQGRNTSLISGPIYIHHIKGSGDIWVNTVLWSWLKGSFPHFGVPLSSLPAGEQKPRSKRHPKPDGSKLIGHLDPEKRKMLWDKEMEDYSNFVYIGGISIGADPAHPEDTDRSLSQFRDLIIYTHETGNHWQFGAVGIPELGFLQKLNRRGKPDFKVFTGSDPIYTHIFLKEPKRGHDPFILRTPGTYRAPR